MESSLKLIARTVVMSVLLSLAACGFKLRTKIELPVELTKMYIESGGQSLSIFPLLRTRLKQQGINLMDRPGDATAIIYLQNERYKRRVLTVSASGRVQEFLLVYSVDFSVKVSSGTSLLEKSALRVERELAFDESAVTAKSQEEAQLKQAMLQEAARQLLRRLQLISEDQFPRSLPGKDM